MPVSTFNSVPTICAHLRTDQYFRHISRSFVFEHKYSESCVTQVIRNHIRPAWVWEFSNRRSVARVTCIDTAADCKPIPPSRYRRWSRGISWVFVISVFFLIVHSLHRITSMYRIQRNKWLPYRHYYLQVSLKQWPLFQFCLLILSNAKRNKGTFNAKTTVLSNFVTNINDEHIF